MGLSEESAKANAAPWRRYDQLIKFNIAQREGRAAHNLVIYTKILQSEESTERLGHASCSLLGPHCPLDRPPCRRPPNLHGALLAGVNAQPRSYPTQASLRGALDQLEGFGVCTHNLLCLCCLQPTSSLQLLVAAAPPLQASTHVTNIKFCNYVAQLEDGLRAIVLVNAVSKLVVFDGGPCR